MFSQQNGDSQNLVHCVSDAAAENEPGMRDFEHKSRSKILTSQPENPFRDYLVCEKQLALPGFCGLNA